MPGVQTMYTLEVAHDHTFVVGHGQWVVHNSNCSQVFQNLTDTGFTFTQHFKDTFVGRASGLTADDVTSILQNGRHFYDTRDFNLVAVDTIRGKGIFRIAYASVDMNTLISIAGKNNRAASIMGDPIRYVLPWTIIPDWFNPF